MRSPRNTGIKEHFGYIVAMRIGIFITCCLALIGGCNKNGDGTATTSTSTSVQLTLDWKPEPEFGGFYAALQDGAFAKHGLDVKIQPAGEGADTWQLVATGRTEFATSSADQVLIARKQNADVIAIFAVYQTFPQGIMVHQSRGFLSIKDVFSHDGVLLAEDNSWLHFLQKKFAPVQVKVTGYGGGIAEFLAKKDYSQQCFVTSEPILAKHHGGDPQTFLIADEGFNPYTTVVICKGELLKTHPDEVKAMVEACREGWRDYLDHPDPVNAVMHGLNTDMDLQTFGEAAAAEKPLIETDETRKSGLGTMTADRWKALAGQLVDLGVIDRSVDPNGCFVNP
jgi:NitT/TauT family transport system substrate-binding protein